MPQDKDKCVNCGATYGLHHGDTDQCPAGGFEAPAGKKQRWQHSMFCKDISGDKVAELEAKVQAMEKRLKVLEGRNYTDLDGRGRGLGRRN